MFEASRHRWATRRVRPGNGRVLKPFRWWHLAMGRGLFYLPPSPASGRAATYAVDIRRWGRRSGGEPVAHLYLDGRHHAQSKTPATFAVEDGVVVVAMSRFGIKRCQHVDPAGRARALDPDPRSAVGRRAALARDHPTASGLLAAVSLLLLVIGVGLNLLQLVEPISQLPPVARNVGTFASPIRLPVWLNISLALGAVLASTERALRLRYHWLLDGAAH